MERTEDRFFLLLVAAVTIALVLIIRPFFGAVLWAIVAALTFYPLMGVIMKRLNGRRGLAALLTVLVILVVAVVPTIIVGMLIVREIVAIYTRIASGNIDPGRMFEQFQAVLPDWAVTLLQRMGLYDLDALRERVTGWVSGSFQTLTARAFDISQSAFGFVLAVGIMLYLAFFLLRDGEQMTDKIERALPLRDSLRRPLFDKIVTVIRAMIKGSFVVAIAQGAIGGVTFALLGIEGALLWGIVMGFFSLLPAIGAGIIWVPVAIYLLIAGSVGKAIILILCGIFIIGMVDNLLRPILVGRDTQMPDYVVLISTLGGIEMFGFNGLVMGPVIAALFIAVWDFFARERKQRRMEQQALEPGI